MDSVVKATIVLHNMLCGDNNSGSQRENGDEEEEDIHDGVLRPLVHAGHRFPDTAIDDRKPFKNYFVSPAEAVP